MAPYKKESNFFLLQKKSPLEVQKLYFPSAILYVNIDN